MPRAALRPSPRLASVLPGLAVITAHGNQLSPDAVLRLALLDRRGCPRWLRSLLWRGFPVRSPTSSVSWARRSRTATSAACIAVSVGDDGTNCTRCLLSNVLVYYLSIYVSTKLYLPSLKTFEGRVGGIFYFLASTRSAWAPVRSLCFLLVDVGSSTHRLVGARRRSSRVGIHPKVPSSGASSMHLYNAS